MQISQLVAELKRLLGSNAVVTAPDALATYDADASMLIACAPQVAVIPTTPEQAATAVSLAVAAGLPIVARGAGTGIAGGAVPVRGGMVLSSVRMDLIERVELRSRRALVGAGVINAELNAHLAPLGFQFAPDPSSQRASTIGGNLATNAGGPHCLKYGVTANHILAIELVRPDGRLIWSGQGLPEDAGYDLTGLIVGSEGTFGPVTRAMVRLTPLPEAKRVVLALFPSVIAASSAVSRVIAAGSLPTSLEVMDHNGIRAVNGAYGLGLPEGKGVTLLIVEVDGVEQGLDEALEEILAICRAQGAFELRPARTAEEQTRVWTARKAFAGALGRLAPAYLLVDTVVPRTRLPFVLEQIEQLSHTYAMEVCNVFHAGDGNLHPLVLYDPRDPDQTQRAHAIAKEVLLLSIAQGGVISGEHGIGLEKQEYLPLLFSPADMELQGAIYTLFNQGDHFNPAKLFPLATPPSELGARRRERLLASRGALVPLAALQATLTDLVGAAFVAPDGAGLRVSPAHVDELAAVVAHCYRAGYAIQATSHGSAPVADGVVQIVTKRMARVLTYEPDDLTITVEAGMRLADLQALLAEHGQILPLDRADDAEVTIGSLVATAADGPRRLGYGTLRDWTIGLTLVEADGTMVRLGAQVVKNVTGYNLTRLLVGSRGTLGVIGTVSLRLFPRPPASATLAIACGERERAFAILDDLAACRLQPVSVEYCEGVEGLLGTGPTLFIGAEGRPATVARHMAELRTLAAHHAALATLTLEAAAEQELWQRVTAIASGELPVATLRIQLVALPVDLQTVLAHAATAATTHGLKLALSARALTGVAYLWVHGPTAELVPFQRTLEQRWPHIELLGGPGLRSERPLWEQGSAPELNRALKETIDPCRAFV